MVFTRDPTEFYKKNHDDIIKFIRSKINHYDPEQVREISQSFYLNLLKNKSLQKYKIEGRLSYSSYIYNVLVWTVSRHYHLLQDEPTVDIDTFEDFLTEKSYENIEVLMDDYLRWTAEHYPRRLQRVIKYLKQRVKGKTTMVIGNYSVHRQNRDAYNAAI